MKDTINSVLKKTVATMLTASLIVYSSGMISFAYDDNSEYDMSDIISSQVKEDTGCLDKNTEKSLNEKGVMDCDIEDFDNETINNINNSDNCYAAVSYYYVDDSNNDGKADEDDMYKLSDSQVDELIEEIYNSGEIEKFKSGEVVELENEPKSSQNKLEKSMGLCVNAFADSRTDSKDSQGGYLRQTITVSDAGKDSHGNPRCCVTYTSTWIKMPKNTKTDVVFLNTDGATIEKYETKYIFRSVVNGTNVTYDGVDDLSGNVKRNTDCIGTNVNLYDDKNNLSYIGHKIYFRVYAIVNNPRKGGFINAYGKYYHQETSKAITPSWGISTGVTASVAFSVSHQEKMHEITPSATVLFYYK
ncbi:MAG: hypothetical protein HDT39_13530 [Lachnospiraceae bacterium]|nr:hypothetical protein [Lachnospiraceae bacterium]